MNQDQIISFGFIVFGAIVCALMLWQRLKRHRARHWPTATGHVETTRVFLQGRGADQSRWVAEVNYLYEAQEAPHLGRLTRDYFLPGRAEKWIARYPHGRVLTIRVNPARVADSVLIEDEQA
jgi:hypothetical protein